MVWTGVLYWLLPRRLRSWWLVLAVSSFGILAAVTLMSVGAGYSRALSEGGLRHTLASTAPAVLNAHLIVPDRPLGPADYQNLRANVEAMAGARVGYLLRDIQRFGRSQPNLPLVLGAGALSPGPDSPLGRPFFLTQLEEHSRLTEGRWPQAAPVLRQNGVQLEAVIGEQAASLMRLRVGSQVSLFPFRTEPSESIVLTVVGLAEPANPSEEYWMGSPFHFTVQEYDERSLVPFYVTERGFFDGLGVKYPAMVGDFGWFLYFDTSVLTADSVNSAREDIAGLESDINKRFPRSLVITGLKRSLANYQKELTLAQVPLYLFIALMVVVILYFLALTMGLLTRSRSEEAGLLRSRGAGVLQVGALLALGEGVAALAAVAVGPLLALAIVRHLLLRTISPMGVGNEGLTVGLSPDMFVMGAAGGFLALAVLTVSALQRARRGAVDTMRERARPPSVPLLHRYYVDLLALAALGLLWWQIGGRGGFLARDLASGELVVDPSLLFGPVLALLAAAFLALRLLPWLARLMAWVGSRGGPPWTAFTLVRLARDPLPHGSLVVMLMMATALGVFGAGFQSTLARAKEEQALYQVGGDLVVHGSRFTESTVEAVAASPGVRAASPVARDSVTLVGGPPGESATVVGIDPRSLPGAAWFKEGFAGKGLADLFGPLGRGSGAPGIVMPEGAESIGVWVRLEIPNLGRAPQSLNLWARVQDGSGSYHDVLWGNLFDPAAGAAGAPGPEGAWKYLEAPLAGEGREMEPPAGLVAVFTSTTAVGSIPPGSISLDDVTVKGGGAPVRGAIIEGFEEPRGWAPLAVVSAEADAVELTPEASRTGRAGLSFSWKEPIGGAFRGVHLPPGPFPLPAIGGPTFQMGQPVRVRAGRQAVPMVVEDVAQYFPTIDPTAGPFLLVDLKDYQEYVRRLPGGRVELPQEIWVAPEVDADRGQVIDSIRQRLPRFSSVRDRETVVEAARRNPLAGGGWDGLTLLGISAVTVAVVLTLTAHAAASAHTGRVDLTVARALGFSRAQLFLSLALERVVVAALGIGAGSAIGIWLGQWVLGYLDITASGRTVVPPMVVTVDGWLAALTLTGLLAATVLSLLLATLWVYRLRAPDVLRTGE